MSALDVAWSVLKNDEYDFHEDMTPFNRHDHDEREERDPYGYGYGMDGEGTKWKQIFEEAVEAELKRDPDKSTQTPKMRRLLELLNLHLQGSWDPETQTQRFGVATSAHEDDGLENEEWKEMYHLMWPRPRLYDWQPIREEDWAAHFKQKKQSEDDEQF